MRYKLLQFFTLTIFVAAVIMFASSCKKETPKPAPWASLAFAGTFGGNETCRATGSEANSITITSTAATQISILNLYGTGKAFTGTVSGDTCIIAPQIYSTDTGNALLQGNMLLSNDTITLSLIATSFSKEVTCQAVLVKQ